MVLSMAKFKNVHHDFHQFYALIMLISTRNLAACATNCMRRESGIGVIYRTLLCLKPEESKVGAFFRLI
jgi:hypothetical protein